MWRALQVLGQGQVERLEWLLSVPVLLVLGLVQQHVEGELPSQFEGWLGVV